MKDLTYVVLFVGLGLAVAYVTSGPFRKPAHLQPRVGTPLSSSPSQSASASDERVYALGTINVAGSLPKEVTQRVLFIIARSSAGGPPVAVKRVEAPTFPFTFSLTPANNMVGTEFYEGDLVVVARLDADGAAGPKQPNDLEAIAPVPANSDRRVAITLVQ